MMGDEQINWYNVYPIGDSPFSSSRGSILEAETHLDAAIRWAEEHHWSSNEIVRVYQQNAGTIKTFNVKIKCDPEILIEEVDGEVPKLYKTGPPVKKK